MPQGAALIVADWIVFRSAHVPLCVHRVVQLPPRSSCKLELDLYFLQGDRSCTCAAKGHGLLRKEGLSNISYFVANFVAIDLVFLMAFIKLLTKVILLSERFQQKSACYYGGTSTKVNLLLKSFGEL